MCTVQNTVHVHDIVQNSCGLGVVRLVNVSGYWSLDKGSLSEADLMVETEDEVNPSK